MLTKCMKYMSKNVPMGVNVGSQAKGLFEAKNIANGTKYIAPYYSTGAYPNSVTLSVASSASAGIHIGSGTTAPTEDDYKLESQITIGFTSSVDVVVAADENDNCIRKYVIAITNTSSSSITISEIGLVQGLYCSSTKGGTNPSGGAFLLDRTLLDQPLTLAAGEVGAIEYTFGISASAA